MIEIDVIILSYAQNLELKQTTSNALNSLIAAENPAEIKFNIVVIESEMTMKPFQYPGTTTIYPVEEFGYHKYMNIGIKSTSAAYICICNNDLIFHQNWATEILKPFQNYIDVYSASPICSIHHPKNGTLLNTGLRMGFRIREEIAGWCLFFRRDLLKYIGELDPNYKFWCADNDYTNTLWVLNLKHVLVTSSVVDHLENKTLKNQTKEVQVQLTEKECVYFEKKWRPKLGEYWTEQ